MNAYYIDTYSSCHLHEMYDASSLLMFATFYNRIEYRADYSSYNEVKSIIKNRWPHHINFRSLEIAEENSFIKRVVKQFYATLINSFYILTAKRDWDVIINYNTAMSLRFVNLASKITRARKVMVVCHGEMYDLVAKRKTSPLFKWGLSLFKDSHTKIADKLYFATLSECIKRNVSKIASENIKPKLISFDHTAIFSDAIVTRKTQNKKLTLGIVGGLRVSKGLNEFFKFAAMIKNNTQVEIRVIGHIESYRSKLNDLGIVLPEGVGEHSLSRDFMYEEIRKLDYVLYFFNTESYGFTASGSVFDAIECERPIIALKNDYFEDLFEITGGFGYLAQDVDEMANYIGSLLIQKECPSYKMKEVKQTLSPEKAALRFLSRYRWMD